MERLNAQKNFVCKRRLTAKLLPKSLQYTHMVILLRRNLSLLSTVFFVLLCSASVSSVAAASTWSQTYGGSSNECAYSALETPDGGYALAGYTTSFGAGSRDFWLVKTDANGTMQWNRTYGGTGMDAAYSLIKTSDGGYALAGALSYSSLWEPNYFTGGDFWLVKTDSNGVMQWNKTYGGTGNDIARALVATPDGGYALAGTWNYTTYYGLSYYGDFWLVKTDASGNMQWNKTYTKTGDTTGYAADYACSLVTTADGGYAIAGYSVSSYDLWVVKTDASGNMQWNKTYGVGAIMDFFGFCSLIATSDGGYAVAGGSWVVKTDAAGNTQWNKTYGEAEGQYAHSLIETTDEGYAIAGGSLLVKTSASGNEQWKQTYTGADAYSVITTSDGGYALAGDYSWDFWLGKSDENGVVPEYSSMLIPALVLTATAFILINKKRPLHKRLQA